MNLHKVISDSAPFAIRLAWGVLICVPATWILMSVSAHSAVLSNESSVAAAAWIQAVGSILAIAGAAAFPYFHEAKKDRIRSERLRRIMLLLARNQHEGLRLLHSTVYNAINDYGQNTINPYIENEWHMKWPPLIEALRSIQITDLDPGQVYMLNEMKVGADYAWSICQRLRDWDVSGDSERLAIQRLNHYWVMAGFAVALLDQSDRSSTL